MSTKNQNVNLDFLFIVLYVPNIFIIFPLCRDRFQIIADG